MSPPPPPPPYNVEVCITSLPIVHVVINIVLGGGGDILIINNSNFIQCPPAILIAHDFYKESTYIISMIV